MKKLLSAVALVAVLAGCTTPKILEATGGSRSDGTIELSYQFGAFEEPVINWEQGLTTATERCKAWGYQNAEKFGGVKTQCQAYNGYGSCMQSFVTVAYQCTGGGKI